MEGTQKPGFWAVLPASIRYDERIPPNAKLLYAELSSLTDTYGYCFADDDYFHDVFGFSIRSIQRLLNTLQESGYIRIETERGQYNTVTQRKIYAGLNPLFTENLVSPKLAKLDDNTRANTQLVSPKLSSSLDKIVETNIIKQEILTIPPIAPQGAACDKRAKGKGKPQRQKTRKELKAAPDWKPKRFAGLRSYYPHGYARNLQREIKAWDALQLSDEEIDTMANALKIMKEDPQWKANIGIPHLSTFLNQQLWTNVDAYGPQQDPAPEAEADQSFTPIGDRL